MIISYVSFPVSISYVSLVSSVLVKELGGIV